MTNNNNAVMWVTPCTKISGKRATPIFRKKNNLEGGGSNFLLEERPIFWEGDNIGHCEKKGPYEHLSNSEWLPTESHSLATMIFRLKCVRLLFVGLDAERILLPS